MCQAIDGLIKMGEEKGYERGKEETEKRMSTAIDGLIKMGEEQGYERGKKEIVTKMMKKGWSVERIAEILEEEVENIQICVNE